MCILGITGDVICFDHHFNVPSRVHVQDDTGKSFPPLHGLFGIMSDRQQIMAMTFCSTTNFQERETLGDDIVSRHRLRGLPSPSAFGDSCCTDCGWLTKHDEGIRVMIDNFHLLHRMAERLPRCHTDRANILMRSLASILCGSIEKKTGMESGEIILQKMNGLIERFERDDQQRQENERLITPEFLESYRNQRHHILNCLPGEDFVHFVEDRNQRKITRRGTSSLEGFWRFLRKRYPEVCGLDLAHTYLLMLVTCWNILRAIQYSSK